MKNLRDVWSSRFMHYIGEVQKYMQFIFTGHIAIVLVFLIGAGGYQYSEWLKVVQTDFPAEIVIAVMIGILLAFSRPTTLLREPDQVYLLPLESKMSQYFSKALAWTFWSQVWIVAIVYIVCIPLLKAVTALTTTEIWTIFLLIIVLKYISVQGEFSYRYSERGQMVWVDRLIRAVIFGAVLYMGLHAQLILAVIATVISVVYIIIFRKKSVGEPVPYEHFVKIEQNRMMSFYRFANYFTDVPHLHGSIRRRRWMDWLYRFVPYGKENAQKYLVFRTFVRTDDHFYLWLRLTAISGVIAVFVDIPVVTWIVAGALSFATTIQLKQALLSSGEFRMDMLYPLPEHARQLAVKQTVRLAMVTQAIIVGLCAITQPMFYLAIVIVIVISELTAKISK
ncbi:MULTISPECIES: ABC transporter permease [Lysinibacillus]|jgi:ABC-2 type transport system permease protein|uniref:Protein EcsB n=1 Tax=Lysinibacillus fusiformis TaxID=28031 RepID=A0A2I0V304_9BACI|nr:MULTISPECIES: ABC transporter permease [Lysinibacillus]KUF37025.1 protein EcsB [Lysinibacillus sp. F5]MEE3808345.1 ABC transporter permease [Lysinibacillus fusiformis]PKU52678.1 protein EcsB [Lysinibacillus fusiformis]SCY88996.1 ABC-2 type transport system permease protein [Lysinibacillus sp. SG9]SDB39233.1 ABC-2 type transport system permease protein [Lysinibacillus sp. TC-37]